MKKLSILFMAVMIAAIAGCAGDTTENNGDLAVVQDLQLDASSTGRTVVLTWAEVTDEIDGYNIYFKAEGEGSWVEAGTSTTTTFTHDAVIAGTYAVMAYEGDNTSSDYSNTVSTMPVVLSGTYTIYDQYAAADKHSGFIFLTDGGDYGVTGLAGSTSFHQDMSAYDDSKGDYDVSLYSGSEQYEEGYDSFFQVPASGVYSNCDPSGSWYISKEILSGDSVLFVKLPYTSGEVAYAKLYNLTVGEESTANGTSVSFSFEYQPKDLGLTLFTSNVN